MIRAVLSDMGKVLLWFDNNIFLKKLAERTGTPFAEVKEKAHFNIDLINRFDRGAIDPPAFRRKILKALGADVEAAEFFAIYNDIFRPNEPVIRLLRRVKEAGYRTALLSNTDPERFGFIRTRFPEILFFDDYALSYELKLLKPGAAIFLEAARRAGCPPAECLFIDDMEENVKGAAAAGLQTILYRPDTDLEAEFKKLGLAF